MAGRARGCGGPAEHVVSAPHLVKVLTRWDTGSHKLLSGLLRRSGGRRPSTMRTGFREAGQLSSPETRPLVPGGASSDAWLHQPSVRWGLWRSSCGEALACGFPVWRGVCGPVVTRLGKGPSSSDLLRDSLRLRFLLRQCPRSSCHQRRGKPSPRSPFTLGEEGWRSHAPMCSGRWADMVSLFARPLCSRGRRSPRRRGERDSAVQSRGSPCIRAAITRSASGETGVFDRQDDVQSERLVRLQKIGKNTPHPAQKRRFG